MKEAINLMKLTEERAITYGEKRKVRKYLARRRDLLIGHNLGHPGC